MPRKSIADILSEKLGGKWSFDTNTNRRWVCEDGRIVNRKIICHCFSVRRPGELCRCDPTYIAEDGTVIDVTSDPRFYEKNGSSSYRLERKWKNRR